MSKFLSTPQVKAIKRQLITREQRKAKGKKASTFEELAEKFGTAVATIVWIADGKCHADVKVPGFDALVKARHERLHKRKTKEVKLKRKTSKRIKIHKRKPKTVLLKGAPKRADYSQWLKGLRKEKKIIARALKAIEKMESAAAKSPATKKRGRPSKVAGVVEAPNKRGRPRKTTTAAEAPAKKRGRPRKVAEISATVKKRGRPKKIKEAEALTTVNSVVPPAAAVVEVAAPMVMAAEEAAPAAAE